MVVLHPGSLTGRQTIEEQTVNEKKSPYGAIDEDKH